MSEFKGTKGKWYVDHINIRRNKYNVICTSIRTDYDYSFAEVFGCDEKAKANALLISKAPEMLEMLIFLRPTFKGTKTGESIEQLIKEATEL
jgi:hypothetical protein